MMSTRRQRKRQARQAQMLDAAMKIVVNKGLDALTIARLARSLDAAVGAIYRYFPSKAALLVALQIQAIELFHEDMRGASDRISAQLIERGHDPETSSSGALCRIFMVLNTYISDAERAPDRHRLIDQLMSTPVPLLNEAELEVVGRSLGPILGFVSELLDKASAIGALSAGDSAQRTHVLWASLHGLDHFRKRDRFEPPNLQVKALTEATATALLLGWGAPRDALEAAADLWQEIGLRP